MAGVKTIKNTEDDHLRTLIMYVVSETDQKAAESATDKII